MLTIGWEPQVDARVLPSPPLKYAKEFGSPTLGSWNLKSLRFQEAAKITSYGLAAFAPERIYGSLGPEGYPVSPRPQLCICSKWRPAVGVWLC